MLILQSVWHTYAANACHDPSSGVIVERHVASDSAGTLPFETCEDFASGPELEDGKGISC